MKKKIFAMLMAAAMMLSMAACGNGAEEKKTENSAGTEAQAADGASALVYGSNDYTRINPAMDEHGEINILIFSGHHMMVRIRLLRGLQRAGTTMKIL